jgi:8-oxo-dGTP diphosphatase
MSKLSQSTLTFLVTDDQVLLGYKKTGFGQGKYLGIGGKIEAGETDLEAANREMEEEIKVTGTDLKKVADLSFVFPHQPDWDQQVHVFRCQKWVGEPTETTEIKPKWVTFNDLPFGQMWDDAKFWLVPVLAGHCLQGQFTFSPELIVTEVLLKEQIWS